MDEVPAFSGGADPGEEDHNKFDATTTLPAALQSEDEEEPDQLAALRASWQFAAAVQLIRILSTVLKLRPFSSSVLEQALLAPEEFRLFLSELLYKLLRRDANAAFADKDAEAWEAQLRTKLNRQWAEHFSSNPLARRGFMDVSPMTRMRVLYALCEWRVHEDPVVREAIRLMADDPDATTDPLRQQPIGEDAKGHLYYFFATNLEDCRLYREELQRPQQHQQQPGRPQPQRQQPVRQQYMGVTSSTASSVGPRVDTDLNPSLDATWHTAATTLEDLQALALSFEGSVVPCERRLHAVLAHELVPKLVESAAARRRAEEKAALLAAMPKKRSSRLQELEDQKKKEDEEQRQQQEAARRARVEREREQERLRKEAYLHAGLPGPPKDLQLTREERHMARLQRTVGRFGDAFATDSGLSGRSNASDTHAAAGDAGGTRRGSAGGSEAGACSAGGGATAAGVPAGHVAAGGRGRQREHGMGWWPLVGHGAVVAVRRRTHRPRPQSDVGMLFACADARMPRADVHVPRSAAAPAGGVAIGSGGQRQSLRRRSRLSSEGGNGAVDADEDPYARFPVIRQRGEQEGPAEQGSGRRAGSRGRGRGRSGSVRGRSGSSSGRGRGRGRGRGGAGGRAPPKPRARSEDMYYDGPPSQGEDGAASDASGGSGDWQQQQQQQQQRWAPGRASGQGRDSSSGRPRRKSRAHSDSDDDEEYVPSGAVRTQPHEGRTRRRPSVGTSGDGSGGGGGGAGMSYHERLRQVQQQAQQHLQKAEGAEPHHILYKQLREQQDHTASYDELVLRHQQQYQQQPHQQEQQPSLLQQPRLSYPGMQQHPAAPFAQHAVANGSGVHGPSQGTFALLQQQMQQQQQQKQQHDGFAQHQQQLHQQQQQQGGLMPPQQQQQQQQQQHGGFAQHQLQQQQGSLALQQRQQQQPRLPAQPQEQQQQSEWQQRLMQLINGLPAEERQRLQALPALERRQQMANMLQSNLGMQAGSGGLAPGHSSMPGGLMQQQQQQQQQIFQNQAQLYQRQ